MVEVASAVLLATASVVVLTSPTFQYDPVVVAIVTDYLLLGWVLLGIPML